jgi:hypothetical protein
MPTVIGPIPIPTRSLKTGSVMIVNPSIFRRTVLWPSQAACSPVSGHSAGTGVCGDGATGREPSLDICRITLGAVRRTEAAPLFEELLG